MTALYMVRHEIVSAIFDTHYEVIGLFSSEEGAREAIAELEKDPEFLGSPGVFEIDEYTLDKTRWLSGFVTMPEPLCR